MEVLNGVNGLVSSSVDGLILSGGDRVVVLNSGLKIDENISDKVLKHDN